MAFKTILSVVTKTQTPLPELEGALDLAAKIDAHLDVLCLGIDRTQTGFYYAGATAFVQQETLERAEEDARDIETLVRARLAPETLRWSCEGAIAQIGSVSPLVGMRARFADLMVAPRPYGASIGAEAEAIVEAALFDARIPVLIAPEETRLNLTPKRVVVAWNQSDESLSAIRKALPLLQGADLVDITIIDPPAHGPERSDPGGQLSNWLARQGCRVEVSVLAKSMPKIADILHRHVRDSSADLLVMGAYGHSRFREAILGGATRHMLESAQVPVFMAH